MTDSRMGRRKEFRDKRRAEQLTQIYVMESLCPRASSFWHLPESQKLCVSLLLSCSGMPFCNVTFVFLAFFRHSPGFLLFHFVGVPRRPPQLAQTSSLLTSLYAFQPNPPSLLPASYWAASSVLNSYHMSGNMLSLLIDSNPYNLHPKY